MSNNGWKVVILSFVLLLTMSACGKEKENADRAGEKASSAWEKIEKQGKIVVATSGTLYPTSFHEEGSDDLTGYEVEIMKEAAKRLDIGIEFKELGFDGILASLNNGTVDAAVNDIEITEQRKEKFSFSDPYKYSYGTMIVRKDDVSKIKTLDDLKGKKSAGASTSIYMQIAVEHGAEEVTYDNATNEQYLRDVAYGRTDVILNDYYLQTLALAAFPELEIMIHPDIKYHPNEQAVVVKKGNEDILDKLNEVLAEMKEDGAIQELSKQFFGGEDVTEKQHVEVE